MANLKELGNLIKSTAKRNKILISCLGNQKFNLSKYIFDNDANQSYESYCFSLSVFEYLKQKKEQPNQLIILGTEKSIWDSFFQGLGELLSEHDLISGAEKAIFDISGKLDNNNFSAFLQKTEQQINQFLSAKKINLSVNTVIHRSNFNTPENQTLIFDKILPVIKNDSDVYIDITNGLRVAPIISFLTVTCLKNITPNITIQKIFYAKMNSLVPEKIKKPIIDTIYSKYATLTREGTPEQIKTISQKIQEIIRQYPNENVQYCGKVLSVEPMKEFTDLAIKLNQYKYTGNLDCLLDYFDDTTPYKSILKKSAEFENICKFDLTQKEISKIECEQLNEYLGRNEYLRLFRQIIIDKISLNRTDNPTALYESLTKHYFYANDLIRSCCAFQYFIEKKYGSGSQTVNTAAPSTDQVKNIKNDIIKNMLHDKNDSACSNKQKVKKYNRFIETIRTILIHKADKYQAYQNSNSAISQFGCSYTSLKQELADIFSCFHIDVATEKQNRFHDNVLISYLGNGSYNQTKYKLDQQELKISNFVTIPLAETIDNLKQIIIIGTETSAWNEFADNLISFRPNSELLAKLCLRIKELFNENHKIPKTDISEINCRLKEIKDDIGCEVILFITDENCAGYEDYADIYDFLCNNLLDNVNISMDITHCFRQFPIIMYGAVQLMCTAGDRCLQNIFYADQQQPKIETKDNDNVTVNTKLDILSLHNLSEQNLKQAGSQIMPIIEKYAQTPATGTINRLTEMLKLTEYSFEISTYNKTRNLMSMNGIFTDHGADLSKTINEIAFYEYINQFEKTTELYKNIEDRFGELTTKDPILSKLSNTIEKHLSWINYSDKTDAEQKKKIMLDRVEFYLEQNDYLNAVLFAYQFLEEYSDTDNDELRTIKKYIRQCRNYMLHGKRIASFSPQVIRHDIIDFLKFSKKSLA